MIPTMPSITSLGDLSDGNSRRYTYSGCCRDDRAGNRSGGQNTHLEYDALQRLIKVTDPAGGNTSLLYDENGNLTALVDPMGNTTGFEYDLNDRLTRKIYSDGKAVSFAYDGAGQLVRRINARNQTTTFGYDENGNLETINYQAARPTCRSHYDPYNRAIQRTDGVGTTLFTYDKDSRLLSVDGPWCE